MWFRSRVEFGIPKIGDYASKDALSNGHMLMCFDCVLLLQCSAVVRRYLCKCYCGNEHVFFRV